MRPSPIGRYCRMGVRTRGLDIAIGAKRQVADAAASAEAKAVIERWNEQLPPAGICYGHR
jgi:hypothetical protein